MNVAVKREAGRNMVAHGALAVELGDGHEAGGAAEHGGEQCGEHCPFLNRSDKRCSNCLSLDRIDHAFDYCFGAYKGCRVYLELLTERRVRRVCGLIAPDAGGGATTDANSDPIRRPLVQLTVAAAPHGRAHAGALAHR
jgi:hypothetical protein